MRKANACLLKLLFLIYLYKIQTRKQAIYQADRVDWAWRMGYSISCSTARVVLQYSYRRYWSVIGLVLEYRLRGTG